MFASVRQDISAELDKIRADGLFKAERVIVSPQRPSIRVAGGARGPQPLREQLPWPGRRPADHRRRQGGARPLGVRAGQRPLHLRHPGRPQAARAAHLASSSAPRTRSCTRSCFDANGGLFETILGEQDAVISDELNHASIIDGVRLCKARRLRYRNRDMADLEAQLRASADARRRLIATDGVFSMDGYVAPLDEICAPGRALRGDGHGRRLARGGLRRRGRPRDTGAARRHGPRRHGDRDPRQGPGRRERRLHQRPQGDHRPAPPALAAVPLLELGGPRGGRRLAQGPRPARGRRRPACPAAREHHVVPRSG